MKDRELRSLEVRDKRYAVGGLKLEIGGKGFALEVRDWRKKKRFLPQTSIEAILQPNAAEND